MLQIRVALYEENRSHLLKVEGKVCAGKIIIVSSFSFLTTFLKYFLIYLMIFNCLHGFHLMFLKGKKHYLKLSNEVYLK